MVVKEKGYKILVRIFEGKRLVQMSGCRFEVDIKKAIRIRTLRVGIASSGS
jgi:hypothetical protein